MRLTSLGLRQVPVVSTEVGLSFGSTGTQLLGKVQLPLARKTVLLGLNQVIMMAFGIVVIASQIGTGDVGGKVLGRTAEARRQPGVLGRLLHRLRGDRARPHHDRRASRQAGPRNATVWIADRRKLWIGGARSWSSSPPDRHGARRFPTSRRGASASARGPSRSSTGSTSNFRHGVPVVGGTGSISDFLVRDVLDPIRGVPAGRGVVVRGADLRRARLAQRRVATRDVLRGWLLVGIAAMDNWDLAMDTLSQVLVAVIISVCLAIPIGIWCRPVDVAGDRAATVARHRPGAARSSCTSCPWSSCSTSAASPGVIAAVIYALPPGIRLVSLGLKEVPFAPREAAISFGATPRQELFKVQLPLAFKSIMLGINQVILMVLATVIIAGLIGGGALGPGGARRIHQTEPEDG